MTTKPPVDNTKTHRKSFVPRISMRVFFVAICALSIIVALVANRARQQKQACEKLRQQSASLVFQNPPFWLQGLPYSVLTADGGHWCYKLEMVNLSYGEPSQDENAWLSKHTTHLQTLCELPSLQHLNVHAQIVFNNHQKLTQTLSLLKNVNGLQSLTFETTQPNSILQALPDLPDLRTLILKHTHAPESLDLAALKKLPNLESLKFTGTQVARNDLHSIASLLQLRVLQTDLELSAADIECLHGHPSLEYFDFNPGYCTDAILETLATIPRLKSIDARDSWVTDRGLDHLRDTPRLESIRLANTPVTDVGIAALMTCPSLTNIECNRCNITDAIGPSLATAARLQSLDLTGTLVTSDLLKTLRKMKSLKRLAMDSSRASLADVLTFMEDLPPNLTRRELPVTWQTAAYHFGTGNGPIRGDGGIELNGFRGLGGKLGQLRDAKSLSIVMVAGTNTLDSDLEQLSPNSPISYLDISNTSVTAAGLTHLTKYQNTLRTLTIGPFENPDAAMLEVSKLPSLDRLVFYGAGDMTDVGRSALIKLTSLSSIEFPDAEIENSLATELCGTINSLNYLRSHNHTWGYDECDQSRVDAFRNQYGVATGLQKYLAANNNQHPMDIQIAHESELYLLKYASSLRLPNMSLSSVGRIKIDNLYTFELDLTNTKTTDEDLLRMRNVTLTRLIIDDNPVTDVGATGLAKFVILTDLSLSNTRITDVALSRIIYTHPLDVLDVSGTSITDKAWTGTLHNFPNPKRVINLSDVAALPDILRNVPLKYLPPSIVVDRNGFTLTKQSLEDLQHYQDLDYFDNLAICSAVLNLWPAEELFATARRINNLQINRTDRIAEILKLADQQVVRSIEITSETFPAGSAVTFPSSTRTLKLMDCVLTNEALQAMTQCPCLREINIESCDLSNCSLEPLSRIPMLWGLTIKATKLSPQQRSTLNQLRSALANTTGW